MDRRQKIILAILGVLLLAALIVLAVVAASRKPEVIISGFKAPPFEEKATLGVPEGVDGYREINVEGNYTFSLCMEPKIEENDLHIFFASDKDNDAWLLIRIYDVESGEQIGTSGLLREGEYVESVTLSRLPADGAVRVKILSYEKDTYFSLGTASATLPVTLVS